MSHLPDEVLARRAAAGRLECFEEILTRHRLRVYRLCYRMAGNAEDAEDWTQECFVRVYQQLRAYDSARPFTPWMLRVVSNACINLCRTRERQPTGVHLDAAERLPDLQPHADPMHQALQGAAAREARAIVETLSPLLREAFLLWALEDLTFRELGEVLGVPLPTAAARVRRALQQIRAEFPDTPP